MPPVLVQPRTKAPARVPELDGFRGLAILLVVTGHTLTFTLHRIQIGLKIAEVGVLLFFVLSGYLITGLLRDESDRTGVIRLAAFYCRRACRLLPALGVYLAVVALLSWFGVIGGVRSADFVIAIFYVGNIFGRSQALAHLWSLSLEEQFYTFWPLLFVLLGSRRMRRAALALSLLVMAARGMGIAFALQDYNTGVFYLRPWYRFDAIAVGCWLAVSRLPKAPGLLPVFAAAGLFAWSLFGEPLAAPLFITFQTLLAATMLFSVIQGGVWVRRFFENAGLRWLGGISYSLYLWQQILTVAPLQRGWAPPFPLNLALAVALAVASRKLVEEPVLEWGRRRFGPPNQLAVSLNRSSEMCTGKI
jgi:peptidoglycan/LPS O-acetylase OafA/YrhL